ncbi:MAG TPA: cytochrome c peroxidase [Chitinophagaceae bacterium]|nr:cytochrome c peroxidase [Chitinophagaceae bacterium]
MQKSAFVLATISFITALVSFTTGNNETNKLRKIYSSPPSKWPRPWVDEKISWTELGLLPESPFENQKDSLLHIIELGKTLFFDPRLSASGKISCATCHQPEQNWTDGKEKSIGHLGAVNKRNSPTVQNSWFYKRLFWDGRAKDLQDQAFAPIISESEMGSDMPDVIRKLRNSKGYQELFKKAYGDEGIDPDRMTAAIAVFEKTVISQRSRFDDFLAGNIKALTNNELRGLHLFRTKAKCMNCHYGPLFTDNSFHNIGFSQNDAGYFKVSHRDNDSGKIKTPSLRDVMNTGPWMHDGQENNMAAIIEKLNKATQIRGASELIQPLNLSASEKADLLAFLKAISSPPAKFQKPVLPE